MLISKLIKKNQHFSGSDKSTMLFFLLINVKMPTIGVGILTFMSRNCWHFNIYEQEKFHVHERTNERTENQVAILQGYFSN